jgi:hypothetical protein
MNNERKSVQHSFAKKMSAPLIFSPPKVVGYQQNQMEMEEEMDSGHLEHEEETTQTDDASKTELREKELMMNLMEAMRLQQLADYNRCFYQPKNRNGSFFYFETASDEDDDAPENSVIDSSVEKETAFFSEVRHEQADHFLEEETSQNSEQEELFDDSSSTFTSEEFYDKDLTAGDSQEETADSFDDEDLLREGKDVLAEAIEEDFMEQNSEDSDPSYDCYPIDEKDFVSDECGEENLPAVDSREETEVAFDAGNLFEEPTDILEESIQEANFIEQDSEDSDPSYDCYPIDEKDFVSDECGEENLPAVDSREETEVAFDAGNLFEEPTDILEESIQEANFIEQDSEDSDPSYDCYPIDEKDFVSDECGEENLPAVDSREETEVAFDAGNLFEEPTDILEESIQEANFIEQNSEDDEPFHEPHFSQEDAFISKESYENLSAIGIDSLEDDEIVFDDNEPAINKKNAPYEMEHLQDEHRKEKRRHRKRKSTFLPDDSNENRLPIAKLPVLLATADIDLDIFDSFDLPAPITSLTKSDWTVHCLEGRVLLPSTTVFLKGILVADIEYVSDVSTYCMQTTKIKLPWKTTTKVDWIYPPLMPSNSHGEYMFQCSGGKESGLHREYHEQFAEQVQFELQSISHVWTEELVPQAGTPKLLIQGSASLSINLLQPQYISLHSI